MHAESRNEERTVPRINPKLSTDHTSTWINVQQNYDEISPSGLIFMLSKEVEN